MAQNVYDNPTFFASYNTLPRSQNGLASAPEWPLLKSMVLAGNPNLSGSRVLDLGCGYGWFCRWAAEEGLAARVEGVDISEKMLERAKEMTDSSLESRIEYQRADLDTLDLKENTYDVIYSSLTLHYIQNLPRLLSTIHSALTAHPQARFIFSIEHPIYTAPKTDKWHRDDEADLESWLLNGYGEEGERVRDWLGQDVRKYHRTTQTYLSTLLQCGFVLRGFVEWMPSEADLNEHPDWRVERNRPAFLLVCVERGV
ncbi:S-adenosyl-L-methionine-dependent methyltransferase [Aspergillus carlsbadensis]|nr:S-adenosyl-L-methionine-dependent methyltransferase [Aspergillus carlsbadensis]